MPRFRREFTRNKALALFFIIFVAHNFLHMPRKKRLLVVISKITPPPIGPIGGGFYFSIFFVNFFSIDIKNFLGHIWDISDNQEKFFVRKILSGQILRV